jgi:aminopeptidase N
VGLEFDFIIVHESAHEWWGNSVTSKDIADMWIHEGFGAYAEALYVEDQWGYDAAIDYINAKKVSVANDRPIIGVYEVQNAGSRDMYNKGQLVLNTVRSILSDDDLWFSILKGLATEFRMQTITSDDVFRYINQRAGRDLTPVFDQYFRSTGIPELEVLITWKDDESTMKYRWTGVGDKFAMPVKVTLTEEEFSMIHPTTAWQTMRLGSIDPRAFRMADNLFYATLNLQWAYLDPAKDDEEFLRK